MAVRTALAYSISTQFVVKTISLLSVVLLARLLTPDELGIYAIASAAVMILNELQNLGTSTYIIKEKNIDTLTKRKCLGLSISICWFMALLLILFSQSIAFFYEIDSLKNLLMLFAIPFLISPFNVVPYAILQKEFLFKKIFFIKVVSQAFQLVTTLTFIFLGYSFYSIVLGSIVEQSSRFLLLRLFIPKECLWRPSFHKIGHIIKFGLHLTSANLLNRLSFSAIDLVIGKLGTPKETALFSRGVGLLNYLKSTISMGISSVSLPYLVNSHDIKDENSIIEAYLYSTCLYISMCIPVLAIAGVLSFPVITLFFGSQWEKSAEIVPYLTIWFIFKSLHPFATALLSILKLEKYCNLRALFGFSATIWAVIAGYEQGLTMIAKLLILVGIIDFIFISLILVKYTKFTVTEYLKTTKKNIVLVSACSIYAVFLNETLSFSKMDSLTFFIAALILIPPVWIILLRQLKLPLYSEILRFLKSSSKYLLNH